MKRVCILLITIYLIVLQGCKNSNDTVDYNSLKEKYGTFYKGKVPYTGKAIAHYDYNLLNKLLNRRVVESVYTFKEGKWNGVRLCYTMQGELEIEIPYKMGIRHGTYKSYYTDGTPREEIEFRDGLWNGIHKEYYSNGSLRSKCTYRDDKKQGIEERYYSNGTVATRSNYVNGCENGLTIIHHDNNEIDSITYADGKRVKVKGYYPSGRLMRNWTHGTTDTIKNYFENGNLSSLYYIQGGEFHGYYTTYYLNGKIKRKVPLKKNKITGYIIEYSDNGKEKSRSEYYNDIDIIELTEESFELPVIEYNIQ